MSVRINLLPHREVRRKAQRKHLAYLAGMVSALGLTLAIFVHGIFATQKSFQDDRNTFLKREIALLDKEIEEIKKLKEEIVALLARKQVIERLQSDRAQAVQLLDQLVRQVPEGIYLKQVKQTGLVVRLEGYAQSNARVSTLMRNLAGSPHLQNPDLIEIKASNVAIGGGLPKRLSEFSMNVRLRPAATEDGKGAAKAGAADKGGKKG